MGLNTNDVYNVGRMLIAVGDEYPTQFLTERDFYPLVLAYLTGYRAAAGDKIEAEYKVDGGYVDFRVGGTNPVYLELAVAPRAFRDHVREGFVFPGHDHETSATQLCPSQNSTELLKLFKLPFSQAKMRYLLLVDFRNQYNSRDALKAPYEEAATKYIGKLDDVNPVRIVYVAPTENASFDFGIGRKLKADEEAVLADADAAPTS